MNNRRWTMTASATRGITVLGALLAGTVAVVSVQARQTSPNDSGTALLAEVRAMRSELRDAAASSMRAQLLVARLSLQEQRLTVLHRELVDVQTQLAAAGRDRAETERLLGGFRDATKDPAVSRDMRRDIEAQ